MRNSTLERKQKQREQFEQDVNEMMDQTVFMAKTGMKKMLPFALAVLVCGIVVIGGLAAGITKIFGVW